MDKTKLLIVSNLMLQAGSERWIYEICKHINKDKFEVGVLCGSQYLNSEESNFSNYYYLELKKIGVALYEYIGGHDGRSYFKRGIDRIERTVKKFLGEKKIYVNPKIVKLFQSYDVICFSDFSNYDILKKEVHQITDGKFFIILFTHKVQFSFDPYKCFDKDRTYNFTYSCPKQIVEISDSGIDIDNNNFFYNPLVMDLSGYRNLHNPIINQSLVISIFTRISKTKPIDMFLEAFKKLQEKSEYKCALNIYGEIQEENYYSELQEKITDLGLDKDGVRFMGHAKSIADTITKDKINVYWGASVNTSVGYSSIEVGSMGIPSFYWNFDDESDSTEPERQTNGSIPAYNQIDDFVKANLKYTNDNEKLRALSVKQRDYFLNNHDINSRIKNFEELVTSIRDV